MTVVINGTTGVSSSGGDTSTSLTTTTLVATTVNGLTVGKGAGSVATNTAVGSGALASGSQSGLYNSAFAYGALANNTTGSGSTAGGLNALANNTTGSNNTAWGNSALVNNTTASNNTAVGYQAGYTNSTGNSSTFVGYQAGYTSNNSATYSGNTCLGYRAGYSLTTGVNNTFVGGLDATNNYASGSLITTGSKNTILGNYAGNQGGLDIRTANNYIVLSDGDGNPRGYFNSDGDFYIGNTNGTSWPNGGVTLFKSYGGVQAIGASHATGAASGSTFGVFAYAGAVIGSITQNGTTGVLYNTSSDYRLKDITGPITGEQAKTFIMALQPKQGSWKADGSPFAGFVAHEFQEVSPSSVSGEKDAVDENGNAKMQAMQASSPEVMANLVAYIQELETRLSALENK